VAKSGGWNYKSNKEENEKNPIEIITEGSRSERGVGSGVAIYRSGESTDTIQFRLNRNARKTRRKILQNLRALEHTQ